MTVPDAVAVELSVNPRGQNHHVADLKERMADRQNTGVFKTTPCCGRYVFAWHEKPADFGRQLVQQQQQQQRAGSTRNSIGAT